jgi:ribosomal protein S18 acetylase RimI-like enzyme
MTADDIFPAIATTWPPASVQHAGPFTVPAPDPGGNRVSAARLTDTTARSVSEEGLDAAEAVMLAQSRAPLFQVLNTQTGLSDALDARGYIARDHTDLMVIASTDLAAVPPPVTAFDIWPPLAIQTDLFEAGGIDAARRAVMDRATCPKTTLFGRIMDKPAGVAFIGVHDNIAMLHALEIAPVARRKGLASHLMRAAAHWALQNGAPWLSILVTQQNEGAQRLYASLGLKTVGTYVYREKQGGHGR